VPPPVPRVKDPSSAWELAETFFGFPFPDEYVQLLRRYGNGELFARTEGGDLEYVRLWDPRKIFYEGPSTLGNDRHFRDEFGEPFSARPDPWPSPPITRINTNINADWPFWPEPAGTVPIGDSEGCELHLLRHLDPPRVTVGWVLHEWGVVETSVGPAEWLCGWLDGDHSLDGDPGGTYGNGFADAELGFAPDPRSLHVAHLEPSAAALGERAAALAATAGVPPERGLRSPLWNGMTDVPADRAPLAYAAGDWQRLDFPFSLGDGHGIRCWYDDAVDGSDAHLLGVFVAAHRRDAGDDVLRALAGALDCRITEVVEL
jgi:hypothetical protein